MKTPFEILNELYDATSIHSIGEIFNAVYESTAVSQRTVYNPAGLKYWRASLGRTQVNQGGVDIMCLGDSFMLGLNLASWTVAPWPMLLRKKLQARFNPSGVPGGRGWIAAQPGAGSVGLSPNGTQWGTGANDGKMVGGAGYRNSPTADTGTYELTMGNGASVDPAVLGTALPHASDIEAVVSAGASIFGTVQMAKDFAAGSYTNLETVTLAGVPSANYTSGLRFGVHQDDNNGWSVGSVPTSGVYKFKLTSLDKATKYMDLDAFIHYNGDFKCGVRVHNFGNVGKQARHIVHDDVSVNGAVMGAVKAEGLNPIFGFDDDAYYSLYSYAGSGVANAGDVPTNKRVGLFIMSYGVNEYNVATSAPTESDPVALYNSLKWAIERIIALRAAPLSGGTALSPASILLVPQWHIAKDGTAAATDDDLRTHRWAEYVQVAYRLADEFPDCVAVCDIFELTGRGLKLSTNSKNAYVDDTGMYQSDKLHPSYIGMEFIAQAVFEALI
jgi:hypothetical protein